MVRPNNEFLLAWDSISSDKLEHGWQLIAVPASGQLELRAGRRSPDNLEAVLVGFPFASFGSAEKLPDVQGFSVEHTDLDGDGILWIALTRKIAGSLDFFTMIVCDVVGTLDRATIVEKDQSTLLRIFVGRIRLWQEFMRKGNQALSPAAEIGLIGELTFLRELIDVKVSATLALESWVGPFDSAQDFELGAGAVEAKTTLSSVGFFAEIGSLIQLADSAHQPLFVAGIRLKQSAEGQSLPRMICALRELIKDSPLCVRLMEERLLAAGYIDLHTNRYSRKFQKLEILVLEVTNDFPRLTPDNVPSGVVEATYRIDLGKLAKDNIGVPAALKKLGIL